MQILNIVPEILTNYMMFNHILQFSKHTSGAQTSNDAITYKRKTLSIFYKVWELPTATDNTRSYSNR
jgi:hypothetical protein